MDNGGSSYRRYLDGDDEGMRDLIELYYDSLTLYLNSYLQNLPDAEELAELTFVTLVTKRPVYDGRSSFKTFLYSIGRHITIDHMRKESRTAAMPIGESEPPSGEDIERDYIREEQKRALYRAMGRLKAEYRQILWLTYFEEVPCAEAARIMEKSVFSTEHLLRRARAALKDEMKKEGYTSERS